MIIIINKKEKSWPDNNEIIEKYLYTFRNSKQSQNTRKSSLNYFFDENYFGYSNHVFEIGKRNLMEYKDYLNHLETISLSTKKTKWTILHSFLSFVEDYYEEEYDIFFKFPKEKKWKAIHKEPKSNTDIFLTMEEIKQILDYLKRTNFKYYLIFRLFGESGVRKGGVINLDYDKVFLEKRYIDTKEKNGRVVYYLAEGLQDYLRIYLQERKLIETETKALFLSTRLKRFSNRAFNEYLNGFERKNKKGEVVKVKGVLDRIPSITKKITCQVFRRSLNLLRFEMGCDDRIMRILLNHKVKGVNFNNYVKKGLDYRRFLNYFDSWNPYTTAKVNL